MLGVWLMGGDEAQLRGGRGRWSGLVSRSLVGFLRHLSGHLALSTIEAVTCLPIHSAYAGGIACESCSRGIQSIPIALCCASRGILHTPTSTVRRGLIRFVAWGNLGVQTE